MRAIIGQYKRNAKKRGQNYELTEKQFAEITKKDCHYCGAKPNNVTKHSIQSFGKYIYNGIDRINSNKGYTIENIVPCCKLCNQAKNDLTLQEFKDLIEKIYLKMFES
jgi:5-methylcytosine-specific restriction endonuclease McrA